VFVRALVVLLVLIGHLGLGFDALATGPGFGTEAHDHAERAAGAEDPLAHEDNGCDHGCHAAAHLLGVIPHRPALPICPLTVPSAGHLGIWRTHTPRPPTKPPRYSL
jgi:hypothetical protein